MRVWPYQSSKVKYIHWFIEYPCECITVGMRGASRGPFPFISFYNSIANQPKSALSQPMPISFHLLLEFNSKSTKIGSEPDEINFFYFHRFWDTKVIQSKLFQSA
jgi:hypothetical protein